MLYQYGMGVRSSAALSQPTATLEGVAQRATVKTVVTAVTSASIRFEAALIQFALHANFPGSGSKSTCGSK